MLPAVLELLEALHHREQVQTLLDGEMLYSRRQVRLQAIQHLRRGQLLRLLLVLDLPAVA